MKVVKCFMKLAAIGLLAVSILVGVLPLYAENKDSISGKKAAGWTSINIGKVDIKGDYTYAAATGTFNITGYGSDIWNSKDAFHFVYKTMKGNGQITARIVNAEAVNEWTKVGIMMRKDLTEGSQHASVIFAPGNNLACFQRREDQLKGSFSDSVSSKTPCWLMLTREGNIFKGFVSEDKKKWRFIGTDVINMPETIYVGLAATSHAEKLCHASIDNVSTGALKKIEYMTETDRRRASITPDKVLDIERIYKIEYGQIKRPKLYMNMVRPVKKLSKPMPALIFMHGISGNIDGDVGMFTHFAQQGYFCVTIQYRSLQDCKCAVRFLRSKAKEYNIDPERIGVWGHSLGGEVAIYAGITSHVKELEGSVGWDKYPSNVNAVCSLAGPTEFTGDMSMSKFIDKNDPPLLILHGKNDEVIPWQGSQRLYDELKKVGGDVTIRLFDGLDHSSFNVDHYEMVKEFFDKCFKYIC